MPRDLLGSLLTEVSRAGFGFRHLTPRAQVDPRSAPRPSLPRFSGPHALRAHRLLARGRCLPRIQYCSPRAGGKELCPLRTTRGSGDAVVETAEGLRLAVVEQPPARDKQGGKGIAWCVVPGRARLNQAPDLEPARTPVLTHTPRGGSAGLSCLACSDRSRRAATCR